MQSSYIDGIISLHLIIELNRNAPYNDAIINSAEPISVY